MHNTTARDGRVAVRDLLLPGEPDTRTTRTGASEMGWRAAGWFGALLALVGLVDMALVWYPLQFGNPEWEFGAIDLSFSTLPLLSIGLAAVLASALATGSTVRVRVVAAGLILLACLFLMLYALYLTTVPIALKMAPAVAVTGIKKAIVRTSLLALVFSTAYLVSAVAALLHTRTRKGGGDV